MFKPPVQLSTQRLALRAVCESDAPGIFSYASNPNVTKYLSFPTYTSVDAAVSRAAFCASNWSSGPGYCFAIIANATSQFIGIIELTVGDEEAELGYVIDQPFWNNGYATEAARGIIDWVRGERQLTRIWAVCNPVNTASQQVLRKAGFSFEGSSENAKPRPQLTEQPGSLLMFSLKFG